MMIKRSLYTVLLLGLVFSASGAMPAQEDPRVPDKGREIRLETRILRYQFRRGSAPEIETVATQEFKTVDNTPAAMSVDGVYSLEIVPKIVGGGALLINGKLTMPIPKGEPARTAVNARRVGSGVKIRVTGLTDAEDKSVQEQVRKGDLPNNGTLVAYYLEVSARVTPG